MEKQGNETKVEGGVVPADQKNDFFNTGRIGRRNALPDILGQNSTTSVADLPTRLSGLTTKGWCGFFGCICFYFVVL